MPKARRVWAIVAGTVGAAFVLATDVVPWLRGDWPAMARDTQWVWAYGAPRWPVMLLALGVLALYMLGAFALADRAHAWRRFVLWAYLGAVLLPLALTALEGPPLFVWWTRAVSPFTGGYPYAAHAMTDMGAALRDWPHFVRDYRALVNLNPPGGAALSPPALVALAEGVTHTLGAFSPLAAPLDLLARAQQCQNLALMRWPRADMAATWAQVLMPLAAALTVASLYRLGKTLFGEAQARWAALLWALVPALTLFAPRYNTFFALVTAVLLVVLWRGLLQERLRWIALAGFVLSVAVAMNLSLVPLGLLAGLTLIGYRLGGQRGAWRRLALELAALGAGSVSVWALYWALGGTPPLEMARFLLGQHYQMNRPYFPWVLLHPLDMAEFVGVPLMALAVWRALRVRRGHLGAGDVLALSAFGTLGILTLSGTARGETGRVWFFLAPIWVLLAADVLITLSKTERVALVTAQALTLLVMAAFLRANFTTYTLPPRVSAAERAPTFPVNATFEQGADRLTLVGLDAEATPDTVTLRFYWRADGRVRGPYALTLVSVGPNGRAGENMTWNPRGWNYPPTCWRPGQTFVDEVRVPVDQAGAWLFSLAVVDAFSSEPMLVTLGDGTHSDQVGIGPVRVPE